MVPLYRYWNPGIGDHFYTTNFAELGQGRHGWRLEGIQSYVQPQRATGSQPLYRYWNSGIGDHFYTTNFAELGQGRHGWRLEGIQCYVYPQSVLVLPLSPESASSSVPATFLTESCSGQAISELSQGDNWEAADVPCLAGECDDGTADSFNTVAEGAALFGSFETSGPAGGAGTEFGPSSFQTEAKPSSGEVSINVTVNKPG